MTKQSSRSRVTKLRRFSVPEYNPQHSTDFDKVHVYEVVFASWKYYSIHEVSIGGNCAGMENFDGIIDDIYDALDDDDQGNAFIELKSNEGNILYVHDEEDKGYNFLKEMVMSVRFLRFEDR